MELKLYPIGVLAKSANVSIQTIRYYERLKLFVPITRKTSKRIRYYNDDSLHILNFIKSAQKHGFQLEEIRTILDAKKGNKLSRGTIVKIVKTKLSNVQTEIEKLRYIEDLLMKLLSKSSLESEDGEILKRLERFDDSI